MKHNKTILVTGGAGFIGSNLINILLNFNCKVYCLDNYDAFYKRSIKENNIIRFKKNPNFIFIENDILNPSKWSSEVNDKIDCIVHLAAKAGVRPSIANPENYFQANVGGTLKMLEWAKKKNIEKFIFASSSSVYGKNPNVPWHETDYFDPISPYAASKIAAEQLIKVYAHLNNTQSIILRFFTVYGPGQRPDLAIHKFFNLIHNNQAIPFFGDGSSSRDYTYIDDIVNGIIGAINKQVLSGQTETYNLGNSRPISLNELVDLISEVSGKKAKLEKHPMQDGDVIATYSKIENAIGNLNYLPKTRLIDGLTQFYKWFLETQKQ